MRKFKLLMLLAISVGFWSCKKDENASTKNNGFWEEAKPLTILGNSPVFPNGIVAQKHINSASVNTMPPFVTYLNSPIGNPGLDNGIKKVERPAYAQPDTYSKKIYFDSKASESGDGTLEKPYNNLDGLKNGNLLADSTAYLIKANSVFMLSGIQQDYNTPRTRMYFGMYGEGDLPVICNANSFTNPTEKSSGFWFYGKQIAINQLHLVYCEGASYSIILHIGGDGDLTIANSHIESMPDANGNYAAYAIKGGVNNLTIYNTEIAYTKMDMFYLSTQVSGYQFVSNYFHHCNMGSYSEADFDPNNRETWRYVSGDIIQFESGTPVNSYFANNVFDRSDTPGKFCFIINGGTPLVETQGTTIEYNTFINPLQKFGGAGCYIQSHVILKDNLFISTDDPDGPISGLASSSVFVPNYTGNHFVNFNGGETYGISFSELDESNQKYEDLSAYQSDVPLQERKGSSLY